MGEFGAAEVDTPVDGNGEFGDAVIGGIGGVTGRPTSREDDDESKKVRPSSVEIGEENFLSSTKGKSFLKSTTRHS